MVLKRIKFLFPKHSSGSGITLRKERCNRPEYYAYETFVCKRPKYYTYKTFVCKRPKYYTYKTFVCKRPKYYTYKTRICNRREYSTYKTTWMVFECPFLHISFHVVPPFRLLCLLWAFKCWWVWLEYVRAAFNAGLRSLFICCSYVWWVTCIKQQCSQKHVCLHGRLRYA